MRALKYRSGKLVQEIVDKPTITGDTDVLIKVIFCGICGTDVQVLSGKYSLPSEGQTMGHETAGIVIQVGEKVTKVAVNDRVTVNPMKSCGQCFFCDRNQMTQCLDGGIKDYQGLTGIRDGGYAEFVVASEDCIIKLPQDLPLEIGTQIEPFSCIGNIVKRSFPLPPNPRVLVIGAGAAGVQALLTLHYNGVTDVTVTNRGSGRRAIVEKLGIARKVLHPDCLGETAEHDDGQPRGFDAIYECSGSLDAVQKSWGWLRGEGCLMIYGCNAEDSIMEVKPMDVCCKDYRMIGSVLGPHAFPGAVDVAASAYRKGLLTVEAFGAKIMQLDEYEDALSALMEKKVMKVIFQIGE